MPGPLEIGPGGSLPPPEFLLDAEWELERIRAAQPKIRGLNKEEAAESDWQSKLANYDNLSPGEKAVIDHEFTRRARAKYESEYGVFAAFLNPGLDGTGTFNDLTTLIQAFVGGPVVPRTGQPLASRQGRRQARGKRPTSSPKIQDELDKKRKPPDERDPWFPLKPEFPPPAADPRVSNRRGHSTPHVYHIRGAGAEEEAAHYIHRLPFEVVIYWGDKIGSHGADIISYNLKTKLVTLWDVKYRSSPVRIQPSRTFDSGTNRLANARSRAIKAIGNSSLSSADKEIAIKSLHTHRFQTRTLGAGNAMNSTSGSR